MAVLALRGKYLASWEGGFIVRDAKGLQTFIIRKMINGVVFKVSTRCHAHGPAMEQLRRFEANPSSFRVGGTAAVAIFLDEELITEFLHHSKEVKKNSDKWCRDQSRYLGWWQERLGNRDLRKWFPGAFAEVGRRLFHYREVDCNTSKVLSGEEPGK